MSALKTSDPLVVNTRDGVCWERRAVTSDGRGLYAVEGSCRCPEFVMATLAELAEHGIVGSADVLPVPVGPEQLTLSEQQVETLAEAGNRAVNDAVHEDLCMCDTWPEECLSSGGFFQGYWDFGGMETAIPAVLAVWERMRGGEMNGLLARVAELESERHSTNESLSEAAEALRVQRDRLAELEEQVRLLNTQRGDAAQLIERERGEGEECVDIDDLVAALSLGSDETAVKCRCGEPDADPYACEADDCAGELSELNPFGGGPVQGHDARVSRTCGCGWTTTVWHVGDGSAEAELHGHVVSVHGGVYPAGVAQ